MSIKHFFKLSPLSAAIKVSSLGLLFAVAAQTQAVETLLPGETRTIETDEPINSWSVSEGAHLIVNGATTQGIDVTLGALTANSGSTVGAIAARQGSTVILDGASVRTLAASVTGLLLTNSDATLSNTSIESLGGAGVALNRTVADTNGSRLDVSDSSIRGLQAGVTMTEFAEVSLDRSQVTGTAVGSSGVTIQHSLVTANQSTVTGERNGARFAALAGGVQHATLVLNQSTVEGQTGAALQVTGRAGRIMVADIEVLNGSQLIGGNGNLLEVTDTGTVNMNVDNSGLNGNVILVGDSTLNLNLQNNASLIGDLNVEVGSMANLSLQNSASLTGDVNVEAGSTANLSLQNNALLIGDVNIVGSSTADLGLHSNVAMTGDVNVANDSTANLDLQNSVSLTGNINVDDASTADFSLQNNALMTGNFSVATDSMANLSLQNFASLLGNVSVQNRSTANLALQDNASLIGNVSVGNASTASLSLDNNASLVGDVTVEADSFAELSLHNSSSLTGTLTNVASLNIGDQSIWTLTGTSSVGDLTLVDSTVKLGEAHTFYELNLDTLSGNGTFVMSADFARGLNDFLNISGNATGEYSLLLSSSGAEPVSASEVHVVHTGGGDAEFSLVGGSVDIGAWSYGLKQDGGDWFLDPGQRTISPGTSSVLALFNTAPTVWYGEMTSLRSRMGELRHNGGAAGGWVRSYGNKYSVAGANGEGYKQNQRGFSLGADMSLSEDSQWLVGVLAGHSQSDLDLGRGTSGTVKSYYAGVYATWMDDDSGYYFDGVVKANRFENDSKVRLSDGAKAKGKYGTNGIGASAELGRHIKLDKQFFIEPFAQVSTVAVKGKKYALDNGMQAKGENTHSALGKLGVTVGRDFVLDSGSVIQPYLRTAVAHEFAKNNKASVNGNVFNNDLSGSRVELGAGVAVSLSKNLQLHADFEHSRGKHIDQPWGANVGVRYSW